MHIHRDFCFSPCIYGFLLLPSLRVTFEGSTYTHGCFQYSPLRALLASRHTLNSKKSQYNLFTSAIFLLSYTQKVSERVLCDHNSTYTKLGVNKANTFVRSEHESFLTYSTSCRGGRAGSIWEHRVVRAAGDTKQRKKPGVTTSRSYRSPFLSSASPRRSWSFPAAA